MIPAILSCVFVIYLYHSLNGDSQKSNRSIEPASNSKDPLQSLVERLDGLQKRLNALSENDKAGSGR